MDFTWMWACSRTNSVANLKCLFQICTKKQKKLKDFLTKFHTIAKFDNSAKSNKCYWFFMNVGNWTILLIISNNCLKCELKWMGSRLIFQKELGWHTEPPSQSPSPFFLGFRPRFVLCLQLSIGDLFWPQSKFLDAPELFIQKLVCHPAPKVLDEPVLFITKLMPHRSFRRSSFSSNNELDSIEVQTIETGNFYKFSFLFSPPFTSTPLPFVLKIMFRNRGRPHRSELY